MRGVDYVFHAASLKQVPSFEFYPMQAVETNLFGTKNINYIGFANEEKKEKLLIEHDVFCLPSKLNEGSPVSIIEALAYSLPIIGVNKGCIGEMIMDCGYIINGQFTKTKVQDALIEVIKDYEKYSKKSEEKFCKTYNKKEFIAQLDKICMSK